MKFELSAFHHAVSESAFSEQETHMLEHKLRTTTVNITKNSAASKKLTLTSCFHHVC